MILHIQFQHTLQTNTNILSQHWQNSSCRSLKGLNNVQIIQVQKQDWQSSTQGWELSKSEWENSCASHVSVHSSVCVCVKKLNKQDLQHREQGPSNNTHTHTQRVQEIKVSVTIVCMCVYQKETEEVLYLHYPLVHHNLAHFILRGGWGWWWWGGQKCACIVSVSLIGIKRPQLF